MPTVSVIVPNYNHEKYLPSRLESIFSQTYQDFEVIILDDCSTDNSPQVLEKYRNHQNVSHIVFNQQNSGSPFKQWNKGVALANGQYIWIAESDDEAAATFLEKLVPYLNNDLKLGLAYCQSKIIDNMGQGIGSSLKWTNIFSKSKWKQNYRESGTNELANCIGLANTIPNASAVLFRKEIYMKSGGADETMRVCGDWVAWMKLLSISDIQFHADSLNSHRYHSGTIRNSVDKEKYRKEYLKARDLGASLINQSNKTVDDVKHDILMKIKVYTSDLEYPYTPNELIHLIRKYPFLGYKSLFFFLFIYLRCLLTIFISRARIFIGKFRTKRLVNE